MADSHRKPAKSLGQYELERELVRSSFGSLFIGRISEGPEQGKPVAIRVIELQGRDPALLERASMAARTSLELRHLNVARVIDVLETEDSLSVVSEYVDAVPLSAVMRACTSRAVQMPTPLALRIAGDVLAGLGAAHRLWSTLGEQAQWFFGGLEPGSVLITKTGNVRVFDLGVAACLVGDDLEAETLVYRAPERLDSTRQFDARAGVYSVGVLLWEMLSNRRLFPSMLTAPPHVVAAGLPDEVAAVIACALSRQPAERFETADQMALELRALQGEGAAKANDVVAFLHRVRAEEGRSTRPPAPEELDGAEEVRIPRPPRLPGTGALDDAQAKQTAELLAELDMPTVPAKKEKKPANQADPPPAKVDASSELVAEAEAASASRPVQPALASSSPAPSRPPPSSSAPSSSRPSRRRRTVVAVAALIVAVSLLGLLGGFSALRGASAAPPATPGSSPETPSR